MAVEQNICIVHLSPLKPSLSCRRLPSLPRYHGYINKWEEDKVEFETESMQNAPRMAELVIHVLCTIKASYVRSVISRLVGYMFVSIRMER